MEKILYATDELTGLIGAEMLGWELDKLIEETILAMRVDEETINDFMRNV